jgi:hypothetical protein
MIARALLIAALAASCTGCVGLMIDKPWTREVRNPVPLKAKNPLGGSDDLDRWACQPGSSSSERQTKDRFLASWGVPKEKVPTAKGESWIYSESGRWCGIWILAILPLPVLLPVCETFDHVVFESDLAIASESRRMDGFAIGAGIFPLPWAAMARPARATDSHPRVLVFPEKDKDSACAP